MPSSCVVAFNNNTGVYYAGEEVTGTVHLTTTNEKTIRGIEIKVLGYVRTWFHVRQGKHSRLTYAEEHLIDSGGYEIGRNDGPTFTFHPGTYHYDFRCHIPAKSASSFNGQYGIVRYIVNVKVNRYLTFDNIFKEPFVVVSSLDLNFNPKLRMPASVNKSKQYVQCCNNGSLNVYLSTPIIGYVPGQTVPYKILIDNETNSDLNKIFVGISQNCFFETYIPHKYKRESEYKIMRKPIGTILRYSRKEIYDNLVMPPVSPSTIDTSRIIVICYGLYLEVESGCCKKKFKVSIPLTVGAIPIENTYEMPIRPPVFKHAVQITDDPFRMDPKDGIFFGNQVRKYDIQYPVYDDLTTKIQRIEVKILGYARAWCYQNRGRRRILYHGEGKFLDSGGCVVGEEHGSSFSFQPGTYSYTFKSKIPTKAPTTFEGQYGVIRYIVHIKIFRNLMYDNLFKVPFVVVLPLDLNFNPNLRMPSSLDDTKVFSCPCWTSGSIEVKLSTPMTGYVPGQKVFYKSIIDNESNFDINDVFIGILQKVSYEMTHPTNKQKESEYKLIKQKIGPVRRHDQKEVTDSIIMPVTPPSTIDTNAIVVICYFLYLQIEFGCCNDDFIQSIPLTVGVIPLYNTADGQNIVDYEISRRHYPPLDSVTPMRPPVFKEYVQDKDNPIQKDPLDGLIDENQVKEYVIKYPFYENLSSHRPGDW